MKNDGYITVEASIILPFVMIILSVLILFTILFHDMIVSRALGVSNMTSVYFNVDSKEKSNNLQLQSNDNSGREEGYLYNAIYSRVNGYGKLLFFSYEVGFSQDLEQSVHHKKNYIRGVDIIEDIFNGLSGLKSNDKFKKVEKEILGE